MPAIMRYIIGAGLHDGAMLTCLYKSLRRNVLDHYAIDSVNSNQRLNAIDNRRRRPLTNHDAIYNRRRTSVYDLYDFLTYFTDKLKKSSHYTLTN